MPRMISSRTRLPAPVVVIPSAAADRPSSLRVQGLLIDIDDTIVRIRPEHSAQYGTGSLMQVLERAGVDLGGLSPAETCRRLERVRTRVQWWHWSDFIVELGLKPRAFWEYAYKVERHYIEAMGPEILPALQRLHGAGIRLYIASNNPSSGILHKLRLAGLADVHGTLLFSQLLGGTELHAMKNQPIYWKKALAHIGMDPHEVAVIGDNPEDDYKVPRSIGIDCTFLVDRCGAYPGPAGPGMIVVPDFTRIADRLLNGEAVTC